MKRFCLSLDLVDDPELIAEYERMHQKIWPEVADSIRASGIVRMEIYRLGTRLAMVVAAEDDFSFEAKTLADAGNPVVERWEQAMWRYQKALPQARPGEKWVPMQRIFSLGEQ